MDPGDEYHLEVGRLVYEFSRLEFGVAMVIWRTLGNLDDGRLHAVTADLSWRARLHTLQRLVWIAEGFHEDTPRKGRCQQWKEFFSEADAITVERNRLIHSPLSLTDPLNSAPQVVTIGVARSKTGWGDLDFRPYTLTAIQRIVERIKAASAKIEELVSPIHDYPKSLGTRAQSSDGPMSS